MNIDRSNGTKTINFGGGGDGGCICGDALIYYFLFFLCVGDEDDAGILDGSSATLLFNFFIMIHDRDTSTQHMIALRIIWGQFFNLRASSTRPLSIDFYLVSVPPLLLGCTMMDEYRASDR